MRIPIAEEVRRLAEPLTRRFSSRGLILLYHRVAELWSDAQLLCAAPKHFEEHLEILRKHAHPMRLQQLVGALRDGGLPHSAISVTFDDGYADTLYNAKPLLERYEVPATVFVATGYIGDGREFWWDELERVLLTPGELPEALRLTVEETVYQWELGEAAHYTEDAYLYHREWNVLEERNPTPRHRLYRELFTMLRSLPDRSRRKVLEELRVWGGAESIDGLPHCTLSSDEISQLAEGNLIEVGSHTVTHPTLSMLPLNVQYAEIHRSKSRLEEILGGPVISFSYPYGSQSDYTPQTAALVREAGFTCACSNYYGVVRRDTDHFQLPRILVRNWDGEEFLRRLKACFRD